MRFILLCVVAAAGCLIVSQAAWAEVADLEKELQASLEQSGKQVSLVARKLERGLDASPEIARLRSLSENIRVTNLLLEERFLLREEKVKTLGSSALSRQLAMAEGCKAALTEYLSLIDTLPSNGSIPQSAIRNLQLLLEKILPKKKRPIIGSLPYKHLNLPAIEPSSAPAITPAYKGGNKTVSLEDTKAAPEAPISKEIAALAQSLGWNPVSIYEYIKNNVETEWYWGCMKGAEETLRQKSGNDCDQTTLLVALLRASGYPTRYVRGVIEFFPDIERAKNLTGIDDPTKIAKFFQNAGIPFKPVIQGGTIANFQIEHIWVETQVPYSNYRGNLIDEHGKAWLGLDTSIKVKGYEYNQPKDMFQEPEVGSQLSRIRDEYLGLATAPTGSTPFELNQTPLEYLQSSINSELRTQNSQFVYADFLRTRVLLPENMKILPASLQFVQVKVTNEYTAIPEELKHKVKLSAVGNWQSSSGSKLLEITFDVLKLSNQQITLSYEPETVQDQEIINSFGGLDSTPAYLVRLRPVLKVNGERIAVATDGLPMGADYTFTIDLISPSGTETINNTLIVGNLTVIGITSQKAVMTPPLAGEGGGLPSNASIGGEGPKVAERILFEAANHYIDRWNNAEDELASLLQLSITRPLPTVVTLGGMIDVTYLLDMPHGFMWKGVYLDADVRAVEVVRSAEFGVGSESKGEKLFMQLSSLQGSVLEHRLFENDFKVESISTAKLFQLVSSQPGTSILTIDKTNVDAILPTLDIAENIKDDIRNSVNRNFAIRIPQSEITYHDWSGIGYIKENPETGESGWMLSGMIAGGSTVDAEWLNNLYLQQTLSTPYAGAVNHNSLAGVRLYTIPATNKQDPKTVGTSLLTPFAAAVLDGKNLPVVGATVTFRIIAGGGTIQCLNQTGGLAGSPSESLCDAQTSNAGIAKAKLTLGKKTDVNPIYMTLETTDVNSTQVGLNLVDAYVIGWGGQVELDHPFEAYGMPDVYGPGKKIETVFPGGTTVSTVVSGVTISNTDIAQSGMPNNPGGSLLARLMDRYDNPISNARLQFASLLMTSQTPTVPLPQEARKIRFYDSAACTVDYPLYGECGPYVETTTPLTDYNGGMTNFVYGNSVNTAYTIMVTAPSFTEVPPVAWTLHIGGYADSQDNYFEPILQIGSLDLYSANGDLVNAAKAGEELKADLKAKLYLIKSDFAVDNAIENCLLGSMQVNCYRVRPKGTILTEPLSHGLVTFKTATGNGMPSSSEDMGNGLYLAKFRTDTMPEKNVIEAWGEAAITVPVIFYDQDKGYHVKLGINPDTVTLKTGQSVYFNKTGDTLVGFCRLEYDPINGTTKTVCYYTDDPNHLQKTTYTAFGIGVDTVVEPQIVLLDDTGRTTVDTTIKYTVQPPEYKAELVDIDLLKAINSTTNVWMDVLYTDQTQGQGSAVIGRGSKTDVESLYKAQAVLNRGSIMEVKGEKKYLPFAELHVLAEGESKSVDEIKFGSGANNKKLYKLELASPAYIDKCTTLAGTITVLNKNGQDISLPITDGQTYAKAYGVQFYKPFFSLGKMCAAEISDTLDGNTKNDYFIVSNRKRTELTSIGGTAVLYGGIGSRIRLTIGNMKKDVPIEPVGVIVLGIDGLRQDVLYSPPGSGGGVIEASYNDPQGCGNASCYVDPSQLKGLCEVMGGKYTKSFFSSSCDPTGWSDKHTKLKDVTAIFPSITLASWASIFSGKMPNETGIVGNEFFARNLNIRVPLKFDNPLGMITFDSGAFKGYDDYKLWNMLFANRNDKSYFFVPYQYSWKTPMSTDGTPQNDKALYTAETIFETISSTPEINSYFKAKNGDPVVVSYSHYARGAYWLTWDIELSWGESQILDKASWQKFDEYLKNKYQTFDNPLTPQRNNVPFSALTVWYIPGIDHEAHLKGMGVYRGYFQNITDEYILKAVNKLKDIGEFDNKIFIVVADHGHTQMPMELTYTYKVKKETGGVDEYPMPAEMSCKFKLDFADPEDTDQINNAKEAERNNNNLHIWELGEVMKQTGFLKGDEGLNYAVMAPQEITSLYTQYSYGAKPDTTSANIIAALNGPMAHIYIKNRANNSWNSPRLVEDRGYVAELFRLTISTNKSPSNLLSLFPLGLFERVVPIAAGIKRLMNSVDMILIRRGSSYEIFYGIKADGSDVLSAPLNYYAELGSDLYVKAMKRIEGMNHPDRSGDIVLIFRDNTFNVTDNRYTSGVSCKSWHGSLNPSDSYVPLILSYPGGNTTEMNKIMQGVTACPNAQCEGNWNVTNIIREITNRQYGTL
jgi:hypothetical protein